MPISSEELISSVNNFLDEDGELGQSQKEAILHGPGPLWIVAGPGTGKTEVLVVRCLKLICVDGISPLSILVTTFTEKAATSLQDRLFDYLGRLQSAYTGHLDDVDISDLRVGTLHSLCNEILQTTRYPGYQNVRLLNEIEQALFLRAERARGLRDRGGIWRSLHYLIPRWSPGRGYRPSLWQVTRAAVTLFNRITEDRLNLEAMRGAGAEWAEIVEEYEAYRQALEGKHRCDFAHLQRIFLEFLDAPKGQQFLAGEPEAGRPPVEFVLVDEYQDTNPIQEEIYFRLADAPPHNLTVVGDDDQALYRFRGGTVECMVEFGERCPVRWAGTTVRRVQLVDNHRSHERIVSWFNDYITSFPGMQAAGARAPGKRPLESRASLSGDYPAVGWISAPRVRDLPAEFVTTVQGLRDNGIVQDYSQCVLLLRSTRESPRYAGPYVQALRGANIPVYNPRSKAYVQREEVAVAMGAFIEVVDPGRRVAGTVQSSGVAQLVADWTDTYTAAAAFHPELRAYVRESQDAVGLLPAGERITAAMPTILYRILSLEPFVSWQREPDRDNRLSKLTRVFEAYCSLVGRPLFVGRTGAGQVSQGWLRKFYYLLLGYLDATGMDDDDLEDEICPPGRFPVMTVHQAKGLQFPFVFVGYLGFTSSPSPVHQLEDAVRPFRASAPRYEFTQVERALHDDVRMLYVAYSRAQYALILLAERGQLKGQNKPAVGGAGFAWFNQLVPRL